MAPPSPGQPTLPPPRRPHVRPPETGTGVHQWFSHAEIIDREGRFQFGKNGHHRFIWGNFRETSEGLTPLNIARDLKLPQTQTPTKTQAPDRQPVPSGPLPSWDLGCSRPPRAAERRVLSAEPATSRRQLPRRPPTQRLVQTDRHPEPLAAPRRAPGAAAGKASAAGYLQGDCFERGAL